jgi:hypothetical protein
VLSDTTADDGKRTIRLQFSAPDARQVRVRIPATDMPLSISFGGAEYPFRINSSEQRIETYVIDIIGRGANGATVEVTLAPKPASSAGKMGWLVQGYWTRLPPDAQKLADARPETAVKIQTGDVSVTTKKLEF